MVTRTVLNWVDPLLSQIVPITNIMLKQCNYTIDYLWTNTYRYRYRYRCIILRRL